MGSEFDRHRHRRLRQQHRQPPAVPYRRVHSVCRAMGAIAANVVPAEVQVSLVPSNQPGLHPFVMGPNGPIPMMAGGSPAQ